MTTIEALKATVNYPLDDENKALLILTKRGLNPAVDVVKSVLDSAEFELATADVYLLLVSTPTIAEGQFQISLTDKTNMLNMAKAIYAKHGEDHGFSTTVSVGTINAPDLW
jgi:hypothetical protein